MSRGSSIWVLPPKRRKRLATMKAGHAGGGYLLSFTSLGEACRVAANLRQRNPEDFLASIVHENLTINIPRNAQETPHEF